MVTTTLSNTGGTLTMNAIIDLRERQIFDVAIREVPKRAAGAVVDDSTYLIKPKTIVIKTRLSSAEKTTLQAIINAVEMTTFIAGNWVYSVWIKVRRPKYKYIVDDGTLRPWETSITMIVETGGLCPTGEQITNGGFEIGTLDDWTSGLATKSNTHAKTGIYSASLNSSGGCVPTYGWIEQDIETLKGLAIPVSCITSFTVWVRAAMGLQGSGGYITITYSDASTEAIQVVGVPFNAWMQVDILSHLDINKFVSKIKFDRVTTYSFKWVDDVILLC